jgi:hypothetical protein
VVLLLSAFVALPSISFGEGTAQPKGTTLTGEVRIIGNGAAWAWVENDAKGAPVRLGITFTETALSGLPEELPAEVKDWEYQLPLPEQASVPPFTHITMNWNPHGHIPPGVYDVPHFDFHFYIIGQAEREKITCKGEDQAKCFKKPEAKYLPADYILPPGTEFPRMGVHWIDPSAPEFNKQPFTKTFIYGSYNGQIAFLEPMATKSYLETKPNITETIKTPPEYQKQGSYPAAYSLKYDPARKEYTVTLEGLTRRE